MKVKTALISVSDKTGLDKFVKGLNKLGVEIISTGGTSKAISSLGVPVTEVASYTGFPEMLDGRVKTLHPKIHAGLLAMRDNQEHMKQLKENNILPIDMVVVNLYPFKETIAKKGVTFEEAVENIDIGGPTMLRSAAKNFRSVAVVSSAGQYDEILTELKGGKCEISEPLLKKLATEVFANTSRYDGLITQYLSKGSKGGQVSTFDRPADKSFVECRDLTPAETENQDFPDKINIEMEKVRDLRYGENPHQRAAFYKDINGVDCIAQAKQFQGKELSFNNIMDLSAAYDMTKEFTAPGVSIVKHTNPCGAAVADTLRQAYLDALDSDPLSAFGSVMGFNGVIDKDMAVMILDKADFVECIIAPDYEKGALEVFSVKKNLRILKYPFSGKADAGSVDIKKISGGALVQDKDLKCLSPQDVKVVTEKKPSEGLMDAMMFGWTVTKYVKSNAIVLCRGTKTVGIGAGQMSRVDSVIVAIRKAGDRSKGAVLISDAFFPKADSVEEAHKAGVAAIIQPGGSIRDGEVIEACNRLGIPMVFTGVRHFRHG